MTIITGKQFDLSNIYACDVNTMKASDRSSIGLMIDRVWVRLMDMFCSTNRVEAKKCLSDLYSVNTTDAQKIELFQQLKKLAGEGYSHLFDYKNENGTESYVIKLQDDTECFSLSLNSISFDKKQVLKGILTPPEKKTLAETFKDDIGRGSYYVGDDQPLEGDPKTRSDEFDKKLTLMGCSDEQRAAIINISNQATFGAITDEAVVSHNRNRVCPGSPDPVLTYTINPDSDGRIRVEGQSLKDFSNLKDERKMQEYLKDFGDPDYRFSKSIDLRFDITVEQDGTLTLNKAEYKNNDNA